MEKIPKIIHYVWFWKWKKPQKVEKCIKSWKKYCPDYEIIERNEENFDIKNSYYCNKFYNKKKRAFASDYARMYVLYNYGWVYFDTDIELLKNIDPLLENEAFTWFQDVFSIWWAVIWAKKWNKIIKDILNFYENKKTRIILPNLLNKIFKKYWSLKYSWNILKIENFKIYTKDYFYPYAYFEKAENMILTKNSYTIHHYDATWLPKIVTGLFFPIIWFIVKLMYNEKIWKK